MKTLKIALVVAILFGAVGVFAYDIVSLKQYEYTASIENNGQNVFIYTVNQDKAICYVAIKTGPAMPPSISCITKETPKPAIVEAKKK